MSKPRRNFTADQKAEVVRRHLRDRVAVGDLAAELDLQPSQVHQWVAAVLAQADKAFQNKPGRRIKDPKVKLKPMNTMARSRVIGGSRTGKNRPLPIFTIGILWKDIGD